MVLNKVRAAALAAALGSAAAIALGPVVLAQDAPKAEAPKPADKAAEDPVVARVNGAEVRRSEVLAAIQQLPPQVQQMPISMVYPAVLDQVVNARLVTQQAYKEKMEQTAEVKARLKAAEERFIQEAWLKKQVDAKINDAMVKQKYDEWLKANPPEDEVRARHILVEKKEEAQELIKKIQGGADFNKLAAEQKIDTASAAQEGDLGYFVKGQMVEPFANAAFAMKPGEVSKEPVETQFGWHVIKVEDRRKSTPPTFEEAAPELRGQVAQDIAGAAIDQVRKGAKVETFGIDGGPMPAPPAPQAPAAEAPVGGQKKP